MQNYVVWFVAALALVIAELFTGTFYLLMIAIGCAVGGLVALTGGEVALQLALGAGVGIVATLVLRRTRWARPVRHGDASRNPDILIDVGAIVHVAHWHDGRARIDYRGAQWDAVLEPGAAEVTGNLVIKAMHGSTLVLGPASDSVTQS